MVDFDPSSAMNISKNDFILAMSLHNTRAAKCQVTRDGALHKLTVKSCPGRENEEVQQLLPWTHPSVLTDLKPFERHRSLH